MANAALSSDVSSLLRLRREERRFVICGSMAFSNEMDRIARILGEKDVPAVVPDDIDFSPELHDEEGYQRYKRGASRAHITKVRDPRTIGILVANFDKHGIDSYVGPNTFAEIAVAFADHKKIYLLNGTPRLYADELSAWGVVTLAGNLDALSEHYLRICRDHASQLKLPWC